MGILWILVSRSGTPVPGGLREASPAPGGPGRQDVPNPGFRDPTFPPSGVLHQPLRDPETGFWTPPGARIFKTAQKSDFD